MLKKETIKQIILTVGLLLLAACTATTAVPEPTAQILPTKSAALRAAVADEESEVIVVEAEAEEVSNDAPAARSADATKLTAAEAERMAKLELELDGAVILYQKSGGFAGVSERWMIYENGRVVDAEGNEWQLSAEQVTNFITTTEQLELSQMRESYVPRGHCCDHFAYDIIVRQGERIYRVETADGVDGTPAALETLLTSAAQLIEAKK